MGVEISIEGRVGLLSIDWRGEYVLGVTMDGMEMVGIRVAGGCSDKRGVAGEVIGAASSTDSRVGSSFFASSTSACSPLVTVVDVSAGSETFESMLIFPVSAAVVMPGLRSAGLSGRDPRSEDVLEFSVPLVTAFAKRSCSLEFGLLRDELRDNPPCSTANFLSTAVFSLPSCFVAASAGFALV